MPLSAQFRDAVLAAEQRFGGRGSQRANRLRPDRRITAGKGTGRRSPSRPARACGSPEGGISPHCRYKHRRASAECLPLRRAFDHLRQQLARAAHERNTLFVFIGARTFADEHQLRLRIADAEDDLVAAFAQTAARAIADIGAECVRACRRRGEAGQRNIGEDRGFSFDGKRFDSVKGVRRSVAATPINLLDTRGPGRIPGACESLRGSFCRSWRARRSFRIWLENLIRNFALRGARQPE